jgi:formiminotetrahydrofolate cyclodeaminase
MLSDLTVRAYLERLASPDPTPGGGCAAALSAQQGAALIAMVAGLTTEKERFADVRPYMQQVSAEAKEAMAAFGADFEADAAAYEAVLAAMKLPKGDDAEKAARTTAVQAALRGAAEVPRRVALRCHELLEELPELASKCNPNAASDVGVAALLLHAALRGALLNVDTNAASLTDGAYVQEVRKEESRLLESAARLAADAERGIRSRR